MSGFIPTDLNFCEIVGEGIDERMIASVLIHSLQIIEFLSGHASWGSLTGFEGHVVGTSSIIGEERVRLIVLSMREMVKGRIRFFCLLLLLNVLVSGTIIQVVVSGSSTNRVYERSRTRLERGSR